MKKLIFIFCALFISVSSQALTLSDIRTQVRRYTNDTATDTDRQRFSNSLIDDAINEAQRDVINQTWCLHTSTGYVLTAQTTYYALPDNYIASEEVTFKDISSNIYELEEVTQKKLTDENPDYEKQAGAPTQYMVRRSTYGADNLEIVYIPIPTSTSTGTVKIDYIHYATDLSGDTDVPYDGALYLYPYHDLLAYYATSKLMLMQGRSNDAVIFTTLYMNGVSLMAVNLGKEHINYYPSAQPSTR